MRTQANEKPVRVTVQPYHPKAGYAEVRIRENAQKKTIAGEDGEYIVWEYDEYVMLVPDREGLMEEVDANLADWIETGRNIETDMQSSIMHEETERIQALVVEGAALAQASTEEPDATVGILADGFDPWEPDREYRQYELFTHDGRVGFARQALTSSSVYPPFSPGVEALYGIRPIPDRNGVYPYEYNMAASVGMRVREGDAIYRCYNPIDPMLWPPSQIPAHFEIEE